MRKRLTTGLATLLLATWALTCGAAQVEAADGTTTPAPTPQNASPVPLQNAPAPDNTLPWRRPGGAATQAPAAPSGTSATPGAVAQRDCREYRQTVTIEGRKQEVHGTACRQPDGRWKIEP